MPLAVLEPGTAVVQASPQVYLRAAGRQGGSSETSAAALASRDVVQVAFAFGMPVSCLSTKQLRQDIADCTSEVSSIPLAAVANCPAARSCSSIAAVGVFALDALRACDWA